MNGAKTENDYDVIVIGMGPIGQTVAERARAAGLSVAAVERELVGGECSYWACIPSKAMLRPVVSVADARRVAGARQAVTGPVDAPAVFARRDGFVAGWNDEGQAGYLKSIGAELVRGQGRLAGPRRVAVETPGGETVPLTARHAVVIATGSRPAMPELAGLAEARPWTNREVDVDPGAKVIGASLYADGYTGRARMVVDEDHRTLLGVTFVGPGVEELIHSATVAVAGQVPVARLWHAVPCFPSISEVWLRLLEAYRNGDMESRDPS